MAIDETLKEDIKIYYETHNLSVAKVYEVFKMCDVSKKTIEAWVTNEKWIKNKYFNTKEKVQQTITTAVTEVVKEETKIQLLQETEKDDNNQTPEYNEKVIAELINDELSTKSLQVKMANNLIKAEVFAKNAKSIGTNKIFHDMLVSAHNAIHAKSASFVINNLNGNITQEDMKNMSNEDLQKIIHQK